MKFYLHHIYMLLSIVAIIVCLCSPSLITFGYVDMSTVAMSNFVTRFVSALTPDVITSATPCVLGILLIVSAAVSAFTMFVSLFQNFSLQKRSSIFNCLILAGYYVMFLVYVLILRGDTTFVDLGWQVCLPLVALILTAMSFYSIRMTEAKMLARANNFRLRD